MEIENYRDVYAELSALYPGKACISAAEVAETLGIDVRTARAAITRRDNPLPAMQAGKKKYVIPIISLAKWLTKKGTI